MVEHKRIKACRGRDCAIRNRCIRYSMYVEHGECGVFLIKEAYQRDYDTCKFQEQIKL